MTRKRAEIFGIDANVEVQNAECLTFEDGHFSLVNCIGVIHHTPDTEACIREIARVLRPGGSAVISVYYKNIILRNWKFLSGLGRVLSMAGAMLRGRGREEIFKQSNVDEIVRLYDGAENPIGKAYSRKEYFALLEPYFIVEDSFLAFFPARALPFKIPKWLHRGLDRNVGFLINATLTKR